MSRPEISVIVPVYRTEPYLRKCLDSIVGQTCRNLEIILVDDGSPDNCGGICDEYAAKDGRIIVIHQENAGVSTARNAGIEIATGRFLAFADSDDWLERDMYEYLLSIAEERRADVVQCGILLEGSGQTRKQFTLTENAELPAVGSFTEEDWQKISNSASNKLYRADAVRDVRFPDWCTWGEDLLYNIAVMLRAERICLGMEAKYHYRQHEDSVCHQETGLTDFERRCTAITHAIKLLGHVPASHKFFFSMHMELVLDTASKLVLSGKRDRELKERLQNCARRALPVVLRHGILNRKDRIKSVLTAYAWWLYRALLLSYKGNRRKTATEKE